jgi:hypothetical protein
MFYSSAIPVPVASTNPILPPTTLGNIVFTNGSFSSGQSTPSTLSPGAGESNSFEEALRQVRYLLTYS